VSELLKMLGVPLRLSVEPIQRVSDNDPGFGWRLSDAARRDIEEIERHAIRCFPLWSRP
jgi:hypothetical protein